MHHHEEPNLVLSPGVGEPHLAVEISGLAFAFDTILALEADQSLPEVLQAWAQAVVNHLQATFARVWTVPPSGIGFQLKANVGLTRLISGVYENVPVGTLVEHIARERLPYATDDLVNDPWLKDPDWAKREGVTAFAGHPLICKGKLIGVATVFSQQPISELAMQVLAATAGTVALTIARNRSEAASEKATRELEAKHAELIAASRHSQLVIESVPNGILVVDQNGLITLANAQAEKLFGFPREELIGQPVEMLLPPSMRAAHPARRDTFFAGPRARAMGAGRDLHAVRKDGSEFPVEIGLNPISTDGETAVLCSIVDITERKSSESALAAASERSQQVIESAPNGILVVDRMGIITLANAQAEKMFGFRREELIGQPVDILLPGPMREAHPGKLSGFFSEPQTRSMGAGRDLFAVHSNGSQFPVEIGLNPMYSNGETSVLCSVVDITERKRAEAELENAVLKLKVKNAELIAAGERSQRIIESAPNGILLVDGAGLITLANAQAEKMFGFQREELIGRPVEMLLPSSMRGSHPARRSEFFTDPQARAMGAGRDLFAIRKNGSEFQVEIGLNPIRTNGQMSVLCSVVDITERKLAEKKILEATRLKSEFLANMSHEIRTPMNVLVGMSGLLLETDLTLDQREQAETIRKGAESLLVVINDSLDFSKMEAGKLDIDPTDFAVDAVVEDVTAFLSQQSGRKGLELTCFVAPDVPQYLYGDDARVRQILTNLVGNAIKFTERGEVNLRVVVASQAETHSTLRFEVQDTGIGIAPETQGRLFQAFMQADGSTTRRYGGTGLGLAISKRLVEMMGGTIGLTSETGKGSTFWFQIPFEYARELKATEGDSSPDLTGVRVLVVDDNETNRIIVKSQLESWNMKPVLAGNALQAVTMVREAAVFGQPMGLVVLDYGMPGMNGVDVARIVRSDENIAATPMMMLTSYTERREAEAARGVGISVYLTKPARKHQLRQAIATVLRQSTDATVAKPRKVTIARQGPKLLLVEDNVDNQKLTIRLLRKYGYDCDVAGNGRQALAMITASDYPLVLMDCQMPEMDGFQATAAIREQEGTARRTPIVAMTAHALQGDRERCLKAGMDDYIPKPVNEGLLLRTIERWAPPSDMPVAIPAASGFRADRLPAAGARVDSIRVLAKVGLEDLIPEYLSNSRQSLLVLAEAVAKADLNTVRAIGHGMKGCGLGYGFPDITEIGREMERAAADQNVLEIQKQIASLDNYLSRLEVVYPNQ